METKTKYRILGILIILGLVIVLLPLFINDRGDQQPEVAVIKAPPFPDQSVQISGNDAGDEQPVANSTPATPVAGMEQQPPSLDPGIADPVLPAEPPKDMVSNENDVASMQNSMQDNNKIEENDHANDSAIAKSTAQAKEKVESNVNQNVDQNLKTANQKRAQTKTAANENITRENKNKEHKDKRVSKISRISLNQPLSKNGLFDLKKPAWVIQIGSFKNKTNAIRLVNRLRANGYKAFVQHVNNNAFGETIRVYVGPEDKQQSARLLLSRLEKDLHVAGIVISYKPLAL